MKKAHVTRKLGEELLDHRRTSGRTREDEETGNRRHLLVQTGNGTRTRLCTISHPIQQRKRHQRKTKTASNNDHPPRRSFRLARRHSERERTSSGRNSPSEPSSLMVAPGSRSVPGKLRADARSVPHLHTCTHRSEDRRGSVQAPGRRDAESLLRRSAEESRAEVGTEHSAYALDRALVRRGAQARTLARGEGRRDAHGEVSKRCVLVAEGVEDVPRLSRRGSALHVVALVSHYRDA